MSYPHTHPRPPRASRRRARLLRAVASSLLAVMLASPPLSGQARLFAPPPGVPAAADFRVTVDGRELFLYDSDVAAFGIFDLTGPVEVVVRPAHDVRWVDVRPRSAGIDPAVRSGEIRFRLDRPRNLSIELNGESRRVLHLFAGAPEQDAPARGAGVRYFEGGRVHDVGIVTLQTGETVYIAGGAVVRGAFRATGGRAVRIMGRGIIDGGALPPGTRLISFDDVRDAAVEGVTLLNSGTWTVVPQRADGFRADGIRILNWRTGSDGIDLVATSHARITNVFVRANDDCIVVKTWGGGAGYPTHQSPDGPNVTDIEVSRSVFWNMPWGNALEIGFELRAATVSDIRFRDLDIIHVERGAALSIHNAENAEVRDILFEDIRIEDARHKLLDLAVVYSQYSRDAPTEQAERTRQYLRGAWDGVLRTPPGTEADHARFRGSIRNVTLRNVAVVDGPIPFSIVAGYDDAHPVDGLHIENLTFLGRRVTTLREAKLSVEHARGVGIR